MSADSADAILTYWLIPAEPARRYFSSLISDLARRFDAPVFEPHVTVYVTNRGQEDPAELLTQAVADSETHRLSVARIDFSDQFTKTVFVQFRPDVALEKLSERLRSASASPRGYQLNPHLSLLYKKLSRETKMQIASSLSLPFEEVLFDSLKAVTSPAIIKSREDVEAWRGVTSKRLAK
jgi:2'-5' RNA ligase